MTEADLEGVERVCAEALWGPSPDGPELVAWWRRNRVRHLLGSDPGGAWVAEEDGRVVGVAMALEREGVWGLSLLAVAQDAAGRGLGGALLDRALAYGDGARGAIILSSEHPAALRLYARAGFALRPCVSAAGPVRFVPDVGAEVRPGTVEDIAWMDEVSRVVRGAGHGREIRRWLDDGATLLCVPGRAWAIASWGRLSALLARDEAAAGVLLDAYLAHVAPTGEAMVDHIAAGHDWAIGRCLDAGLALSPGGAVFVRGELGTLAPYLPSGAYL
jgi:GNAT superfamily N-acetyltransferase